jgi:hypothetical protein
MVPAHGWIIPSVVPRLDASTSQVIRWGYQAREEPPFPGGGAMKRHVICDECGERHVAEYSHEGRFGEGPIYAVVCANQLTDYYTAERLV